MRWRMARESGHARLAANRNLMKLLTFTTLYPNAVRAQHGIFVETRLRKLLASGQAQSRVLAPVPWFPSRHPRFGRYAAWAGVPARERRFDIEVDHPRYPLLPKLGMQVAPFLLAAAMKKHLARMLDEGYDFDLIDAHYFYPDGVAAVLLGRMFNKPVVVTARGSDVNVLPRYRVPHALIAWAARRCAAVVTVSQALNEIVVGLGAPPDRVHTLRNGVDLQMFHPGGREQAHGAGPFRLLSAGNLVPLKGHDLVIRAVADLPDTTLDIAGEGPERARLEALVCALKLGERVRLLGSVPQAGMPRVYANADALVLASSSEGWANVLLEALACGTPVIATRVSGTVDVVSCADAGLILQERSAQAIVHAVRDLRLRGVDRAAARRHAQGFSWDETTGGQLQVFRDVLERWEQ